MRMLKHDTSRVYKFGWICWNSIGSVRFEIRNRRFLIQNLKFLKIQKKSRKNVKKAKVNSKKCGEKSFWNLDRLIHLNFIKFVQMCIKFWFFRNPQNIRNKYDKKLEWIWRHMVKILFQISNIYIVKIYFFQTSITSTISSNFRWIGPNFGQFDPINQ
jgi:hypothetical protein